MVDDVDLALADPHGLQQDVVLAGGVHQERCLERRLGQAAERAAGRHRADEHAGIQEVVRKPDPVAEDRARVNGLEGTLNERRARNLRAEVLGIAAARMRRELRTALIRIPSGLTCSTAWSAARRTPPRPRANCWKDRWVTDEVDAELTTVATPAGGSLSADEVKGRMGFGSTP